MRPRDRSTDSPRLERAQTAQDFAVGIGIFLLATAFVFAFVPTIMTPYADSVAPESSQAERIAATIVDDLSDEQANNISAERFEEEYIDDIDHDDDLAEKLGLRVVGSDSDSRLINRINITIEEFDPDDGYVTNSSTELTAGKNYDGQPGASTTRIVTVHGEGVPADECDPACKLTVRIW